MVSLELILATAPCLFVGLSLQTAAEDGQSLRLVCAPLSPQEGVGIASAAHHEGPDSRDGCHLGCTAEKTMVLSVPNTEGGATHTNKRGRPQALSCFGPLQPSTPLKRSLN